MNSSQPIPESKSDVRSAFTLTELLVVIAIVALLALLAFPALAKTKNNGHAAQCMSNLRRLTAAWTMYVNDNGDRMLANAKPVAGDMSWVASPDNANSAILIDPAQSLIARYVKDAALYKCPADRYQSPSSGPRVRSVAMHAVLGGAPTINNQIAGRTYFAAKKMADLTTPGPASIFVFLDEHPESINDSVFHLVLGLLPASAQLRSLPGGFHNNSGSFSFADGHCEMKRWRDSRTLRQVVYIGYNNSSVPNSEDYVWLNDRSPYKN